MSYTEALDKINDALDKNNGSFGSNIASLRMLQAEWASLTSDKEREKMIKREASEFNKLGIEINSIADANNLLVENTDAYIEAAELRAKATAAEALAADEYTKALLLRNEMEVAQGKAANGERPLSFLQSMQIAFSSKDVLTGKKTPYEAWLERQNDIIGQYDANAELLLKEAQEFEKKWKEKYEQAGFNEPDKNKGGGRKPKDLTDTINKNDIEVRRQYEESITKLTADEYAKRRKDMETQTKYENEQLRERQRKNEAYIKNVDGKYKALTADQVKQVEAQNDLISKTIANNLKALEIELQKLKNEQAVASLQIQRNNINQTDTSPMDTAVENNETVVTANIVVTRDISQMEASLVEERKLMAESLDLEYGLVLDTNRRLLEAGDEEARSEEEILTELNKKKMDLFAEYDKQILEARQADIESQLELVRKGSGEELELLLKRNETARQLALANNARLPASGQQDTSVINARYDKEAGSIQGSFLYGNLQEQQKLDELIFNEVKRSEREITNFKLLQERERWNMQIQLAESGCLDWSDTQVEAAKKTVEKINRELEKAGIGTDVQSTDSDLSGGFKGFLSSVGKNGLGNSLLETLGMDDKSIEALEDATDLIIDNLEDIMDAYVELAEAAVEAAEERVDAAQEAYDAEVEARNNGYANNVATAAKNLAAEQAYLDEKQAMLEEAERQQEALDTLTQVSSLITAVANIWASFTKLGPWGIAGASAATAAMFASFAAAKIKARQVAAATSEYGEGGLEFLSGGSHASGHDIDLGVKNGRGKQMHAEGGEALAIINKKRTRKYRRRLPEIIASLNDGTFEKKFISLGSEAGITYAPDGGAGTGRIDFWDRMLMGMMQATPGAGTKAAMQSPIGSMPQFFQTFPQSDGIIHVNVTAQGQHTAGLGRLEGDVRKIREQNETRYYTLPDGRTVIQRKNVKRIIRH